MYLTSLEPPCSTSSKFAHVIHVVLIIPFPEIVFVASDYKDSSSDPLVI
jgi:hypothetical protein